MVEVASLAETRRHDGCFLPNQLPNQASLPRRSSRHAAAAAKRSIWLIAMRPRWVCVAWSRARTHARGFGFFLAHKYSAAAAAAAASCLSLSCTRSIFFSFSFFSISPPFLTSPHLPLCRLILISPIEASVEHLHTRARSLLRLDSRPRSATPFPNSPSPAAECCLLELAGGSCLAGRGSGSLRALAAGAVGFGFGLVNWLRVRVRAMRR